ncbi:FAD-binding oxidoreductase [Thioclava sp. GXIMD4215]|uniref:NAD(P)/FAD-dependent oxidoreductase n=1 Tax=Thioclava sp. GXIMD4215 TaxID=3131928 RepID=UPI00311B2926
MNFDAIVLGGGIIGLSCALHLQDRGLSVAVLDKAEVGHGASFGHAGLVERSTVVPYAFPRRIADLWRHGFNRGSAVRFDPFYLPRLSPWLLQYWWQSAPKRLQKASQDILPLIQNCVEEHDFLAAKTGSEALYVDRGWIEICRSDHTLKTAWDAAGRLRDYGLKASALDRRAVHALEPSLSSAVVGGVHWMDPKSTVNPAGVTKSYADHFISCGGKILLGDARSLERVSRTRWQVTAADGKISAINVVLATGAAAPEVYTPLGYRIPLAVKRGHHLHFGAADGAALSRPVVDEENGFVLSPMAAGIRMATGIDFSHPSSPPNLKQVRLAEKYAREVLPLGRQVEDKAWVGLRPCLPDMRPVISQAPRHPGLWFAFGHAHHGFTLGPATGRLLAEMVSGSIPFVDPRPFRADRFGACVRFF